MVVDIKNNGRYCYVEGDDCYIFYYLFNFRLNNNRCYFKKKYLDYVLKKLKKNNINYTKYLELGKAKYEFDKRLLKMENMLNNIIDNKDFNKIYRKIIKSIYE